MSKLTAADLQKMLDDAAEIFQRQEKQKRDAGVIMPKPEKEFCIGYAINIRCVETIYTVRRCCWNGEIVTAQADGETCTDCGRIVKDIRFEAPDHAVAANAAWVWLAGLQFWQLVPFPDELHLPQES